MSAREREMRRVRRDARAQVRRLADRLGLPEWSIVPEPEPITYAEAVDELRESFARMVEPIARMQAAFRATGLTVEQVRGAIERERRSGATS